MIDRKAVHATFTIDRTYNATPARVFAVPDDRIVYAYEMHLGDHKISVSLATIEFSPRGKGTLLVFTEQGVFLDGYDDAGSREQGTRALLEQLATTLG